VLLMILGTRPDQRYAQQVER